MNIDDLILKLSQAKDRTAEVVGVYVKDDAVEMDVVDVEFDPDFDTARIMLEDRP